MPLQVQPGGCSRKHGNWILSSAKPHLPWARSVGVQVDEQIVRLRLWQNWEGEEKDKRENYHRLLRRSVPPLRMIVDPYALIWWQVSIKAKSQNIEIHFFNHCLKYTRIRSLLRASNSTSYSGNLVVIWILLVIWDVNIIYVCTTQYIPPLCSVLYTGNTVHI